jgi:nitrogen fixation/metabolism regulation signal transduction histidine kinase
MSEQSAVASQQRFQRSARNYLLDRHFQLKYTGFLVGVALFLSTALGLLLWNSSSQIIRQSERAVEQGRETVKQGQETVARGQQVIQLSRQVSQVVAMNIAKEYKDDPELAKTFGQDAQRDESKLKEEQAKLEKDAAYLSARAQELAEQSDGVARSQRELLWGLVAVLALLVVGIGLAGIVFTHKIAGPIFKMKRLLREVGEGKLVLREKLRKGDELQHFFEAFEKMVEDMRRHQQGEIAKVDEILARLEGAGAGKTEIDVEGVELLRRLRRDMQSQLEA